MPYNMEDFIKYKQYLNTIDKVLEQYFEEQKEYIFCTKGCGHCCEIGQYPFSELEFQYMLLGFFKVQGEEQAKIIQRIREIKEEFNNVEDKNEYRHRCPFLDENKLCTIYEYRGLICRTFGLLTITPQNKCVIPFCHELGLNYSNVYDVENHTIDIDKIKEQGFEHLPNARKTNIKTLMAPEMFEGEPLDFGEIKALADWL